MFFTSHDHEVLIQRNKVAQDNASPSGKGIAAQPLQRLALLTGETKYSISAERCLQLILPALEQAATTAAYAPRWRNIQPASLLVLRGDAKGTQCLPPVYELDELLRTVGRVSAA